MREATNKLLWGRYRQTRSNDTESHYIAKTLFLRLRSKLRYGINESVAVRPTGARSLVLARSLTPAFLTSLRSNVLLLHRSSASLLSILRSRPSPHPLLHYTESGNPTTLRLHTLQRSQDAPIFRSPISAVCLPDKGHNLGSSVALFQELDFPVHRAGMAQDLHTSKGHVDTLPSYLKFPSRTYFVPAFSNRM